MQIWKNAIWYGNFLAIWICQTKGETNGRRAEELQKELSLVFLLISDLISWLRLHQFLRTRTIEANKSLKTDVNGAY